MKTILHRSGPDALAALPMSWLPSLTQYIGICMATCADYHSAAALYDQLRHLSDAELARRGLARDTLARDVCQSFETARRD
jgi:hypothetical protein